MIIVLMLLIPFRYAVDEVLPLTLNKSFKILTGLKFSKFDIDRIIVMMKIEANILKN